MKITPANNVEGCLIPITGTNAYMFRVYNSTDGSFKDYDLRHYDLSITINDNDASLYEHDDGTLTLDHSPETLGIKDGK